MFYCPSYTAVILGGTSKRQCLWSKFATSLLLSLIYYFHGYLHFNWKNIHFIAGKHSSFSYEVWGSSLILMMVVFYCFLTAHVAEASRFSPFPLKVYIFRKMIKKWWPGVACDTWGTCWMSHRTYLLIPAICVRPLLAVIGPGFYLWPGMFLIFIVGSWHNQHSEQRALLSCPDEADVTRKAHTYQDVSWVHRPIPQEFPDVCSHFCGISICFHMQQTHWPDKSH